MMLMGCLIALSQALYIAAISYAGVSVSTLIAICASPLIVVLLSTIIAHERLTPMTLVALVAAIGGTTLLVAAPSQFSTHANIPLFGAFLAFFSACG